MAYHCWTCGNEQIFEVTRTKWGIEDSFQPMSTWKEKAKKKLETEDA